MNQNQSKITGRTMRRLLVGPVLIAGVIVGVFFGLGTGSAHAATLVEYGLTVLGVLMLLAM